MAVSNAGGISLGGIFFGFFDYYGCHHGRYVRRYGLRYIRHLDPMVFTPLHGWGKQRVPAPFRHRQAHSIRQSAGDAHSSARLFRAPVDWIDANFWRPNFPGCSTNQKPMAGAAAHRCDRFSRPFTGRQRQFQSPLSSRGHCPCHSGVHRFPNRRAWHHDTGGCPVATVWYRIRLEFLRRLVWQMVWHKTANSRRKSAFHGVRHCTYDIGCLQTCVVMDQLFCCSGRSANFCSSIHRSVRSSSLADSTSICPPSCWSATNPDRFAFCFFRRQQTAEQNVRRSCNLFCKLQ